MKKLIILVRMIFMNIVDFAILLLLVAVAELMSVTIFQGAI